ALRVRHGPALDWALRNQALVGLSQAPHPAASAKPELRGLLVLDLRDSPVLPHPARVRTRPPASRSNNRLLRAPASLRREQRRTQAGVSPYVLSWSASPRRRKSRENPCFRSRSPRSRCSSSAGWVCACLAAIRMLRRRRLE